MKTTLKILPAFHGDSIIIETFDNNNNPFVILIDGGPSKTFKTCLVKELKYPKIDLIILTHIDDDHIGGLITFLKSSYAENIIFDKIIINAANLARVHAGTQISYAQGIDLEKLLSTKYPTMTILSNIVSDKTNELDLPKGIDIKILSPNTEALKVLYKEWQQIRLPQEGNTQISSTSTKKCKDYEISLGELAKQKEDRNTINADKFNASSLAFALKTPDFYGLFLGDAHANIVCDALDKIKPKPTFPIQFDYIKLSHHGSKYNISTELLNRVQTDKYIISTNGGSKSTLHPDRKTIAKVVCHALRAKDIVFYLNYPFGEIEKKTGQLLQHKEAETNHFQLTYKYILA